MKYLAILLCAIALSGCEPQPKCLRTDIQPVVTYPYMAYYSLGGVWRTLAFMPVTEERPVCVEYEKESRQ